MEIIEIVTLRDCILVKFKGCPDYVRHGANDWGILICNTEKPLFNSDSLWLEGLYAEYNESK